MVTFVAFGLSVGIFLFSVLTVYFRSELQEGRQLALDLVRPSIRTPYQERLPHPGVTGSERA
jgi:hypothetical protein